MGVIVEPETLSCKLRCHQVSCKKKTDANTAKTSQQLDSTSEEPGAAVEQRQGEACQRAHHEHTCDRSDPKKENVQDRLPYRLNRRQYQQHETGTPGEAMNHSRKKWKSVES